MQKDVLWPLPVQALLQQTPSTQLPLFQYKYTDRCPGYGRPREIRVNGIEHCRAGGGKPAHPRRKLCPLSRTNRAAAAYRPADMNRIPAAGPFKTAACSMMRRA